MLRELEVDFWETWVVRPCAVLAFFAIVGYSLWWDVNTWPPAQPRWFQGAQFGDTTLQCCWKVWQCADYASTQPFTNWGADQFQVIADGNGCSEYDLYGKYDDDGLDTCEEIYDYVYFRAPSES